MLIVLSVGAVIALGFILSGRSAKAIKRDTTRSVEVMSRIAEGDISGRSVSLVSSLSKLRDTTDALFKQANQNAASVEETSAALEEFAASIARVGREVAAAADAMNRIAGTSEKISQVVTVITISPSRSTCWPSARA